MTLGAYITIGRIGGAHWTLRFALLALVFGAGAAIRAETARADGLIPGPELGAQIQAQAGAEVDQALAIANSAVAQAQSAVPQVAVRTAPGPVVPTVRVAVSNQPSPAPADALPAQPPAAHVRPAPKTHRQVPHHRPRATPQARGRPPLRTGPSFEPAADAGARAPLIARLAAPAERHQASPRPERAARPAPPPTFPFAPAAPADVGVSAAGGGGGLGGASSTPSPAALAGFLLLALSLFLRPVVWSAWSPGRRVALPPWRPG